MRWIVSLFFFSMIISAQAQIEISLFESKNLGKGCYRIPAIAVAVNGDIIVAADERKESCADLRTNTDINIVLRRSSDQGKSWTPTEYILDFEEGISASDPSFIVDRASEELFLFYNYMDLINEPDIYYFHVIKSSDHGKTWSEPINITDQIAPKTWHKDFKFITSGRGIQTADGTLLHILVHLKKGAFVFGSVDHGKTWSIMSEALYPGDESKIIELLDGQWMVNSRVNKAGLRYIHFSEDQGENWTTYADSSLIDPACNASLLKYSGDTLYFSNLNSTSGRKNLVLRKSTDGGKSWNIIDTIYSGSAAYSTMDRLENGKLVIAFEKDDYQNISFYLVEAIE